MITSEPFQSPDTIITDAESGYAVNVPAIFQGYPQWWVNEAATYARILAKRKELGIVIDDFPMGKPVTMPSRVVRMGDGT